MARLLTSVEWTPSSGLALSLNDVLSINVRRSVDLQHNICDITLKNKLTEDRLYIDSAGLITFNPDQQIDVYAVYDSTGTATLVSTDNLLFSGRVVDFEGDMNDKQTKLKLQCSDSSYIALNKLYVGDETDTPPNLIKKILNFVNYNTADPSKKILYALTTENYSSIHPSWPATAGEIQATNSSGSAFSTQNLARVFKPAYEVINDLSQPEMTGDDTPYRFHVNSGNKFEWYYPSDSARHVIIEGTTTAQSTTYSHPITGATETVSDTNTHNIISFKLKKSVYDVVNFIIYKAGTDMDNVQILNFEYDATSGSPNVKDSFRNWEEIARTMKSTGAQDSGTNALVKLSGDEYSYPSSYSTPFVPGWNSFYNTTVDSDSAYNTAFKLEANRRAKAAAQAIFSKTGSPRWKGTITLKGANFYDPNDNLIFQSSRLGVRAFMKITEVQHVIGKNGWQSVITVEEELTKTSSPS